MNSLDISRLSVLYRQSGLAMHPTLVCDRDTVNVSDLDGLERPYRVLFLCTHNSARSQMAEGILRASGGERVEAFSAGSHPSAVHPLTIGATAAMGIDISGQHSKSMDAFIGQQFDAIITVCDQVREVCPVFPEDHRQVHWSIPDPSAVEGSPEIQFGAFRSVAADLSTRINYFLRTITVNSATS
jgi:protein-tyrosine-phosphatase